MVGGYEVKFAPGRVLTGFSALAVLLKQPERWRGQRIGVVLSGGNVDLAALPWCAQGDHA